MNATQIKERPIIFSGPMVKAILEGRKTQTRRVVKPQPRVSGWRMCTRCKEDADICECEFKADAAAERATRVMKPGPPPLNTCPYGQPADRLWVREAWAGEEGEWVAWRASFDPHKIPGVLEPLGLSEPRWRSPIHMPRWASRLALEVTDVRAERVQEIGIYDVAAEGLDVGGLVAGFEIESDGAPGDDAGEFYDAARECFAESWDKLNAKRGYPWADNPWVWCITFKRVEQPEN